MFFRRMVVGLRDPSLEGIPSTSDFVAASESW